MFALAMVCVALVGAGPPGLGPDELRAYEEARSQAGRSADAHVRLALWCEARGWDEGRLKHLALAVLNDPKHVKARALLGLVSYAGAWTKPESVSARVKADEALAAKLAEYNARRAKFEEMTAYDRKTIRYFEEKGNWHAVRKEKHKLAIKLAPEHVKLGMWCEQNGLKAEATAHFTAAVVLDPHRDATWKHLGYVKHNGRWMSQEQIAAETREAHAQRRANQHWEALLKKWKGWLGDRARQEEALELLAQVADPRAVHAVERLFGAGGPADQQRAVELFAQIDSPAATRDLAELAVSGGTADVRAAATQVLRRREKRDYAGLLVELIHARVHYRVQPVQGPGTTGALLVETPRFKVLRTYDAPPAFRLSSQFYGYVGYDANGLPVVARGAELDRMGRENIVDQGRDELKIEARTAEMLAAAQLKAAVAQQRLAADVADIEQFNAESAARNDRLMSVLHDTLDAPELKDDEDAWHTWWYDQLGYKYDPPPQVQVVQNAIPQSAAPIVMSCFAAGTPVRTIDGPRPIESLRVGDKVLCQDAATGALGFEPVMVVHHNPPSATLRVQLDSGETLVPSIYHRFWRAGRGWAQARELKTGDVLRTLGGRARVESVTAGDTVPVYNLDVAGGRTFFVGQSAALVHDNTLPDAHLQPFDAAPALAASH